MSNFNLIKQFHAAFDPLDRTEDLPHLLTRRVQYMFEEFQETAEAAETLLLASPDNFKASKATLVKELVDVLHVTYGFLHLLEVDADAAFAEVHKSNMSKTPNPGGKAVKGPGYVTAQMDQLL